MSTDVLKSSHGNYYFETVVEWHTEDWNNIAVEVRLNCSFERFNELQNPGIWRRLRAKTQHERNWFPMETDVGAQMKVKQHAIYTKGKPSFLEVRGELSRKRDREHQIMVPLGPEGWCHML